MIPRVRQRSRREIVADIPGNRTAAQRAADMARAAAAEIEDGKRPRGEMIGQQPRDAAIKFLVEHVIVIEHLIVGRPLVEEFSGGGVHAPRLSAMRSTARRSHRAKSAAAS